MRILSLVFLLFFCSCSLLKAFPDNAVEEAIEAEIEKKTGIEIDFTGDSPEKPLSAQKMSVKKF